jgi:3-dehydroquinate dehydratase/shikimate dehydrogenase
VGYDTDAIGFSQSLLDFLHAPNLKHMRVTIIGTGAAAVACAREVFRLGAKALIIGRTSHKASEIAELFGFHWSIFDEWGIHQMYRHNDVIVQATSVGSTTSGQTGADPFRDYQFTGHEVVMDLIYDPPTTTFLERASRANCRILSGYDMLIYQARAQYRLFTGTDFPEDFVWDEQVEKL